MTDFPGSPPKTRKELFERMRAAIAHGWHDMPKGPRDNGSGAPGLLLEDLLGTTQAGNSSGTLSALTW